MRGGVTGIVLTLALALVFASYASYELCGVSVSSDPSLDFVCNYVDHIKYIIGIFLEIGSYFISYTYIGIGAIIGIVVGWIYGKIKNRNRV